MKMTKDELKAALRNFTGSENWYRQPLFKNFTNTDGVQFLAETAEAHWLIDLILSSQYIAAVKAEPFQCWTLSVKDNAAVATCDDGNGTVVYTQAIEFTDFPMEEIKLWLVDSVLMLPSEY